MWAKVGPTHPGCTSSEFTVRDPRRLNASIRNWPDKHYYAPMVIFWKTVKYSVAQYSWHGSSILIALTIGC